jgi:hypothetical protein
MKGFKQASQRGAGCGPGSTVESGPKTIRPGRAREVEGEEGRLEFLGLGVRFSVEIITETNSLYSVTNIPTFSRISAFPNKLQQKYSTK